MERRGEGRGTDETVTLDTVCSCVNTLTIDNHTERTWRRSIAAAGLENLVARDKSLHTSVSFSRYRSNRRHTRLL